MPGEGTWQDGRCTVGAPAAGWEKTEPLDVLVDMLPIHPSVPLPGHYRAVGGCRQVPASPSPPTSTGEDTGPTSLAAVRIGASLGCATGKEGTGDWPRCSTVLSGRPAVGRRGQGRGAHMMVQEESGFRMWQVQAAPQYWRKVW